MEREVPQAYVGRGLSLRLVAGLIEDLPGHGQGALGPEAARAQPLRWLAPYSVPLARAACVAAAWGSSPEAPARLLDQDVGQHVVMTGREAAGMSTPDGS